MYNERKNNIPGLMEAIWDEGGISCEILVGGRIRPGDLARVLSSEEVEERFGNLIVDGGEHAHGFYVRPSKRTTDMVKLGLAGKKDSYKVLMDDDPEGVERLEKSYDTVGLKFWPQSLK
jgi:hypothetical protein